MSLGGEVVEDYVAMRLTLRAHPMAFLRHRLPPGMAPIVEVAGAPTGKGLECARGLMVLGDPGSHLLGLLGSSVLWLVPSTLLAVRWLTFNSMFVS